MDNKLPIAIRGILSTAFLLLVAALLNPTPAQSAFPNAPTAGTLTVVKTLINDNGGSLSNINFSFSVNGGASIPFEADGQNDLAVDNGDYNIVEDATAGYTTTYNNCTAVTIADNSQTCTITNNDQPATLIVKKVVTNDNGGTLNAENFTFTVNGGAAVPFESDGQNDLLLNAGSYSVVEPPVAGYTTTYDNCTGLNIPIGGTETCTITNNDILPELTVIKNVVNNSGGILGSGNFTINVTGTNVSNSSFPGAVSPGTTVTLNAGSYSVAETPVTGYAPSYSPDCTGTIAVGEIKTCTITNDDVSPSLTVIKNVVNNGGSLAPSDFTITVTGTNVSQPSFPGAPSPGTIVTLNAGSYNVSEIQIVGYTATYLGDCSGTIAIGESNTCTVTNTNVPTIKVNPNSGLETEENGNKEILNVVLTTIPSGSVSITITSSKPSEGTVDPNVINFNSTNWNIPKKVEVIGVDDLVVDGDIDYLVTLDPKSSIAAEYQGLKVVLPVTNLDAPTIEWVKPVGNGQVYIIENLNPILLEVRNPGDEPISKVRFYRWVPSANDWVTIGEDLYPPYQQTIYPSELELGWNEIRAFAWGPPGEDQRFSSHPFIFILNGHTVFLPIMMR